MVMSAIQLTFMKTTLQYKLLKDDFEDNNNIVLSNNMYNPYESFNDYENTQDYNIYDSENNNNYVNRLQ
jgi:hypothetical protein